VKPVEGKEPEKKRELRAEERDESFLKRKHKFQAAVTKLADNMLRQHKAGGISRNKNKALFCAVLFCVVSGLHYLCRR